jgi:microcystin-dependent protein
MAAFNLNTASGQAEFQRWVSSVIRNEVTSYTRTALSQSLGGQKQTQNNLDYSNKSLVPIGSIMAFGGVVLPTNFLWCDGTTVSKDKYRRLYNTLGVNRYGTDTATDFYLPDLKARMPKGAATTNANVNINTINALNHLQVNTNSGVALDNSLSTHEHSHDHNFNHTHNNANAGQTANHNHSFVSSGNVNRGTGNASTSAPDHNHAFVGSTATHSHAHGLNANNSNTGSGNSNTANANLSHGHALSGGGIRNHDVSDFSAYQTVNYIIKF